MRGGNALLALSSFRRTTTCNAGIRRRPHGLRAEPHRAMYRARAVLTLIAVLALLPAGAASASSGGAAIAPPQSPTGFDSQAVAYTNFARTLRRGMVGQ